MAGSVFTTTRRTIRRLFRRRKINDECHNKDVIHCSVDSPNTSRCIRSKYIIIVSERERGGRERVRERERERERERYRVGEREIERDREREI